MCDTDRGRGLVDVLAAGAAGTIGVHTDVVRIDLHVDLPAEFRHHVAGDKGSLPLSRRVEGRDADQTVDAVLAPEPSVGILAVHLDRDRLDPGHVAVQEIQHFHGIALFFRPAGIHTVKHGAPVTGLRAACSCVQTEDGIVRVVLSRKEGLGLQLLKIRDELIQHLPDLRDRIRIILLVAHLDHDADILVGGRKLFIALHRTLQAPVLPDDLRRLLRVVPERRLFHHPVQLRDAALLRLEVQGILYLLKRLLVRGECIFHVI